MIPPEIRDYETYIVSYSGGKDSTATLLWALNWLPHERLRVVFCDTGAEWPETLEYLDYIEWELGVVIDRIRAGDRPLPEGSKERQTWATATSLFEMISRRGMWPGARYRYCTKYLKMWPLRLFTPEDSCLLFGERRQESPSRQSLLEWDITGGAFHKAPIFRPVLYWSESQVWDYLRGHRILPNPVYNHATRCGCWCCIMGRPAEVYNFCHLHPDIAQEAADLEGEIGHTWKEKQSINNILAMAQAQMPLFVPRPRFARVGQ